VSVSEKELLIRFPLEKDGREERQEKDEKKKGRKYGKEERKEVRDMEGGHFNKGCVFLHMNASDDDICQIPIYTCPWFRPYLNVKKWTFAISKR